MNTLAQTLTSEQIAAAVRLSGEFGPCTSRCDVEAFYTHGHCAVCNDRIAMGEAFPDDAVVCATCDECIVHRSCAPDGRCPHCSALASSETCPGCGQALVIGDPFDLPAGVNQCSCGALKHTECECNREDRSSIERDLDNARTDIADSLQAMRRTALSPSRRASLDLTLAHLQGLVGLYRCELSHADTCRCLDGYRVVAGVV